MYNLQSRHDQINAEPVKSFIGPYKNDLPVLNVEMVSTFVDKIISCTDKGYKGIGSVVKDTSNFIGSILKTTFN